MLVAPVCHGTKHAYQNLEGGNDLAPEKRTAYLAAVNDLFSRKVVGWSMHFQMQGSLVTDALKMAWFWRPPVPCLFFHSDRGAQICGHAFQNTLAAYKMKGSVSRKGDCWIDLGPSTTHLR